MSNLFICKEAKCSNQKSEQLKGYQKMTCLHAVYKTVTSDLKTHTDWNGENGKRYSMEMEIKRKLR